MQIELLDLGDFDILLCVIRAEVSVCFFGYLLPFFKAGAITSYLTLKHIHRVVQCAGDILIGLFCAEDRASVPDGYLNTLANLFFIKRNGCFRFSREEFVQLGELFLKTLLHVICDVELSGNKLDLHVLYLRI